MSEFIKVLLSLSLSGTLLMLLVLLPKPLYRERFSRRWQYYIWLVVALRFLLPVTPHSTFTGYLFDRMEAALLPDIVENEPVSGMPAAVSNGYPDDDTAALNSYPENDAPVLNSYRKGGAPQNSGHTINSSGRTPSVSGSNPVTGKPYNTDSAPEAGETTENRHASVRTPGKDDSSSLPDNKAPWLPHPELWLFGIWLTGATILLIRKVTLYQSFLHFLKAGNKQISDIETLNLLAVCAERLDVKKEIELCTNSMLASPIMVGFFRPCILLPAIEMPDREYLYYIFTHELIHYKRHDLFYKWFIQLVLCIHWFNPFVYRLAKETGSACELACDEAVIASLDDAGRRAYGNTLLAFLRADNTYKTSAPYVTLTEGARNLKERLGAIMKSGKKSKRMTLITAMATLIICIGFTALGAYAKSGGTLNSSSKASSSLASRNTPSGNISGSNGSNSENDSSATSLTSSSCEYDNGVCYIYIDGADLSNKPLTGFTEGTLGVVLVQKDGYTSLGPFDPANAGNFREQLTQTCENMVKNNILSRKNADIILSFAEDIVQKASLPAGSTSGTASGTTSGYTFVNRGFYQDSYIVEMGWNLSGGGQMISLAKRVPVPLDDGSEIGVYFADSARDYAEDAEVLKAIGNLIDSLRKDNLKGYPDLERPLISRIRKVDSDNLPALAKEYLEENDSVGFSAVFSALQISEQEALCQTLYENSDTSFFVSIIPFMEEDTLLSFLDRAEKDGNTSFFFGLLISGFVPSEHLNSYMEKYYQNNDIVGFSMIAGQLTEEELRGWLERTQKDGNAPFSKVISEKLPLYITHESAEIRFYEDGSPYLHDVITNHTDQAITETEYCMLAYNADGQPLKLKWDFMDSSSEESYSHLAHTKNLNILPGRSKDYRGGWSLEGEAAAHMAYNLLCLKTVTFEDGTVWNNPEFESWYQAYAGKEINAESLETYYPYVYTVSP